MKKFFIKIFFSLFIIPVSSQQLVLHSVPNNILYSLHNDDYTVQVREPNGKWQDLFEYKVIVDADKPQEASMVQFDFEGKVELKVKLNNGVVNTVKIRPAAEDIEYVKNGNIIYFSLDRPTKLSIEINGDRLHNLHVFANELEKEIPDINDSRVMYFAPGLHKPKDQPGNSFNVSSNTTVYLAPGSVINGKFICNRVENVRIIGRGIILEPQRGVEITHSNNIEIDGITVINPSHYTVYGGESANITINNLKSFSSKGWTDGIDLMSCSNVKINDVFLRNSDDCIAIYAHRWNYFGNVKNYTVTNAILWADVAHPINIGLHGSAEDRNVIEDIHFKDITILEHDEDSHEYQGCIALSVSDHNLVKNLTFENIHIEEVQEGQLFNLRVLFNEKYSAAPGLGIKDVLFKNIYYTGSDDISSLVEGYSNDKNVENIVFENINIRGKRAKSLKEANVITGKYVNGLVVR